MISTIQSLINKPQLTRTKTITVKDETLTEKLTAAQAEITRLSNELNKKPVIPDTPFGESLEKIIEIDLDYLIKNLELNSSDTEKLKKSANYAQFAQLRNDLVEAYYKTKASSTNSSVQPVNKVVIDERTM